MTPFGAAAGLSELPLGVVTEVPVAAAWLRAAVCVQTGMVEHTSEESARGADSIGFLCEK